MSVSLTIRQAYSEVNEFLKLLPENEKNMIPQELRNFFEKERDFQYQKGIKSNIPIKEQKLKQETLAIIALLNLQYWCKDENEKEELKKIYTENDKKHQQFLQTKFNSDEIFKKKENLTENVSMVKYKELKLKKLINKIKKFLKS